MNFKRLNDILDRIEQVQRKMDAKPFHDCNSDELNEHIRDLQSINTSIEDLLAESENDE